MELSTLSPLGVPTCSLLQPFGFFGVVQPSAPSLTSTTSRHHRQKRDNPVASNTLFQLGVRLPKKQQPQKSSRDGREPHYPPSLFLNQFGDLVHCLQGATACRYLTTSMGFVFHHVTSCPTHEVNSLPFQHTHPSFPLTDHPLHLRLFILHAVIVATVAMFFDLPFPLFWERAAVLTVLQCLSHVASKS